MPNLMNTDEYSQMYHVEDQLWWYQALRELLRRYLKASIPQGSRVADAGCGTGINSLLLRDLGYSVASFDLSPDAVKYCKQRGLKQAQLGSVTKMPLKAKSMDALIMMDVLIMLTPSEVKKTVSETYRVLKPGGQALFQVAAFEWLRSSHDIVCHVQKRYTRDELEAYFDESDWEIKLSTYRIWLLFPLLAGIKLLKKFLVREDQATGDLWVPPPIFNRALYVIQWCENQLLPQMSLPWGTSFFLVVQKKAKAG